MKTSKALLIVASLAAVGVASAQKKGATKPAVMGTAQLPGDNGKLGQAYTLGKDYLLNLVLTGAHYTKARWNHGSDTLAPNVGQKLLVLDFGVQNPNREITSFGEGVFTFTAIDGEGANHEGAFGVVQKGTATELRVELKPGQRIDGETAILVPAKGPVPKLMVAHRSGGKVLRYDLHGLIAPLPKSFAPNGVDALPTLPGEPGVAYPLLTTDLKYLSTAFKAGAFGDLSEREGQIFMTAKLALTVRTPGNQAFQVHGEAVDEDGERYPGISLYKASREEPSGGIGEPGQEMTVRMLFMVPKGAKIVKLRLWEGDHELASSTVEFPLGIYAKETANP